MNEVAKMLWRSEDRRRWFLVPPGEEPDDGDLAICSATDGRTAFVDRGWAARFETSEEEGRDWAKAELGATLGAMKQGVDAGLARVRQRLDEARRTPVAEDSPIAPDAVPALFALLKSLPRLVLDGLSGDEGRLTETKKAAADLERRLRAAGVDLGGGLSRFPDRLNRLRGGHAERTEQSGSGEP